MIRAPTRIFLRHLLPYRCLACGLVIPDPHSICASCWQKLRFITEPFCPLCGVPYQNALSGQVECADCHITPPTFCKARSLLIYDDLSRELILKLKHADRTDLAPTFAYWLRHQCQPILQASDLLTVVPLHWQRLVRRRYNQAALVAYYLARGQNLPYWPGLLQRIRPTPSQGQKTRAERYENVAGAFRITPRQQASLKNKRILLLDDVMTTGATVNEASRLLHQAGASAVHVITLARVTPRHQA